LLRVDFRPGSGIPKRRAFSARRFFIILLELKTLFQFQGISSPKRRPAISAKSFFPLLIMTALAANLSFAQTNSNPYNEIAEPSAEDVPSGAFTGLKELQTMLDFSFMYSDFNDDDMSGSYGGFPQIGAGVSLATGDRTRFFLSARYGKKSGDPYHDIDGISDPDGITVKALPMMIGMKFNASNRKDFRLYFGGAFQYAFTWEKISTGDGNDNPLDIDASGSTTGYYLFLSPELPLGQGTDALGVDFGFGGSKGNLTSADHSHGVDLTGLHVRIYYTFGV
jgi:hypothetical protein